MKTIKRVLTVILSIAITVCFNPTIAQAALVVENEEVLDVADVVTVSEDIATISSEDLQVEGETVSDDDLDIDSSLSNSVTLLEEGEPDVEVIGNATDRISEDTIESIKWTICYWYGWGNLSNIQIAANEYSATAYAGTAIKDKMDEAFKDATVPITETYLSINVTVGFEDPDEGTVYTQMESFGKVMEIVYTPTGGTANLKTIVAEHEDNYPYDGQCTRFKQVDVEPTDPKDGTFFIDGSEVHIYTTSFLTFGLGSANGVYEVAYNTNGGNETYESVFTNRLVLPTPTKIHGWEFANWLYEDGSIAYPNDPVYANTALTAEWRRPGEEVAPSKNAFVVVKNGDGVDTVTLVDGSRCTTKKVTINTVTGKDKKAYKITRIGNTAFRGNTKITTVVIGPNVKTIGDEAFGGCSKLKSLSIGSGVINIGDEAFGGCNKISILKVNMADIPDELFSGYNIAKLTVGSNVKTIGCRAFENCEKLKTVSFNKNSTCHIGEMAFCSTGITKITTPGDVGYGAFFWCDKLASVTIGKRTKNIGISAFEHCSKLKSVNVGANVETVGDAAFYNCAKLTNAAIGKSVKYVGEYAFADCAKLGSITVKSTHLTELTSVGDNFIEGIKPNATIKLPKKVFDQIKNVFVTKGGAGTKIKFQKSK